MSEKRKVELSIPKEYLEKFIEISKVSGYTMEEIDSMYRDNLAEVQKKESSNPEKLAYLKTFLKIKNEVRTMKDLPTLYFYVYGESGLVDSLDRIRNIAKRTMEKDFTLAVSKGLVTQNGEVIDNRKVLLGRIPNPNFNSPLPEDEHSWVRDVYGLVSSSPTFDSCEIGVLRAHDKKAKELNNIKLWNFYMLKAKEKSRENIMYKTFNAVSGTKLVLMPEVLKEEELLNKIETIEVSEARKAYEKEIEGKEKKPILMYPVSGLVEQVIEKEDRKHVVLTDDTLEGERVLCSFKSIMPINLEIGWETVIFGRPYIRKENFGIEAYGYMVRCK